ncbi:AAA family ATPase [Candidatus Uhrbacteria bacterium]|nr:AAA family ATPase [Candidatus Uhrbacteria bacterium]
MHLERLEIQGFKTFAKKTILTFLPPHDNHYPITAIVGPNGSGKSNSADALRWVLGEQSLKLLRGKQSDDVIFSGSEGKSRSGFAEVTIELNNEDQAMPIDYARVAITRRLYRDGTSEYLLNDRPSRLSDIQLLLAQANIGQRSYGVIGQGMVDHILVASPEERKAFFDDATGVKPFQIKRHESVLKLKRTEENLADVRLVLQEIEPRMRLLKRQASRLEQRAEIEADLHGREEAYYGTQWWELTDQRSKEEKGRALVQEKITTLEAHLHVLEENVRHIAEQDGEDAGLSALQRSYRAAQKSLDDMRHAHFATEKEIELTKVRAQSNWAPLPLSHIIEEVKTVVEELGRLKKLSDVKALHEAIQKIFSRSTSLAKRLERPSPEDIKPDPTLLAKLKMFTEQEATQAKVLSEIEKQIDAYTAKEHQVRAELIQIQTALREKQHERHTLEQEQNRFEIEQARLEERAQGLIKEMDEFMKARAVNVRLARPTHLATTTTEAYPEIQRLRDKLELIGGIDPETIKKYETTKERYEFLDEQATDLQQAIRSTQKIIEELDEQIEKQSKKIFGEINKKFQWYFKMLFDGGTCELIKLTASVKPSEDEQPPETTPEGVEIQATPPGKRLKALNLLSGGERALTSIALLCAIMDVNPSPFVMLDEVDAALDESNTIRFAAILDELSHKSQFIIITHNRATMEKADILYGVTMGDDGISNLLSIHLEDIAQSGTARR